MGCKCVFGAPWPINTRPLENEAQRIRADRRERIATACLAGLVANPECAGKFEDYADFSVKYADALIERLDKEAKP
jgi:hypothetical protein